MRTRYLVLAVAVTLPGGGAAAALSANHPPPRPATVEEIARPTDELDRLVETFERRTEERGGSLEHATLGQLLLQRAGELASVSDYEAAAAAYTSAIEIGGAQVDRLVALGRAELGQHRFAAAADAAARALELDPASLDALALSGDAAFAQGRTDDAATAFDALFAARPDDPAVLVRIAQLDLLRAGPDAGRARADQAVDAAVQAGLSPADQAFYRSFAGNMAYELGLYDVAEALLVQATADAPNDHGALGELARVRHATGDVDAAIALLERANAIVPEPDHLTLLGDLRLLVGDDEGAADDHERGLAIALQDDAHRRAWGRAVIEHDLDHDGDLDRAARLIAAELSERRDAGGYALEAWLHFRRGDLDAARTSIDVALEAGFVDAATWFRAGSISAARGEIDRARTELHAALDLNPGFAPGSEAEVRTLLGTLDPCPTP